MKKIISLITAVALLSILFAGCSGGKKDSVNIIYSIPDNVTKFDPQIANGESSFLLAENIFEGLIHIDEKNNPYSEICSDYSVSDDGLTYTFKLKENLKWSDGTPLTSADFKFGIERTLRKETKSDYATNFFSIKNAQNFYNGKASSNDLGIELPDNNTIIFRLNSADSGFLYSLSMPSAMPCNKAFFDESRGKYGLSVDTLISNGPFVLSSVKDSYILLSRNENYENLEAVKPDNVYIYTNEDMQTAEGEFLSGNRDIILYDGAEISKFSADKYNTLPISNTVWGIIFNLKNDIGKNPDFRKMLYHSIDKNSISDILPDNYELAGGLIPPSAYLGKINYREASNFSSVDYSLEKATKHYQSFIKSIEKLPKLDIIYSQNDDFKSTVASLIYNCQSEFDIYINPTALEQAEFDEKIKSQNFQLAYVSFTSNTHDAMDVLSEFANADNYFGFFDNKFNQMFNIIPTMSNTDAVSQIIKCEQYLINEQTVFVPVEFEKSYYLASKDILGLTLKHFGAKIDLRLLNKNK